MEDERMRLGGAAELPRSAEQICSPYDPDARYSNKRDVTWVGYKVQVTETCDPACEGPHVTTNVETTPDDNMVAVIHNSLARRSLLPGEHLVDKGYTDSHVLVDSWQNHGVTIIGPVADDPSWQARLDDGLTKAAFHVDWDRKVVTCPAGKQNISWLPSTHTESGMVFEARFATRDCFPCPLRPRCARGKREPRIVGMQAREHFEARRTQAPENRGVPGKLRRPCRDRGHVCPGHQPLRPAPVPLHWPCQNAPAARPYRGCDQSGPGCGVVCWHPCRQNALLTFCRPPSGGLTRHRLRHQHQCWERADKREGGEVDGAGDVQPAGDGQHARGGRPRARRDQDAVG